MLQQRQCLTLARKPSLIDGIPLHGGGRRVNKSGLIDAVSNATTLTKRETEDAVNALVHTIVSELRSGRRVAVVGFGSFNPTQRGARMGRNPQTGAPVKISASKGVRFAASSTLKDIVNGKAPLPALKAKPTSARKMSTTKPAAKKALKKTAEKSTTKAVRRSPARKLARRPVGKVARHAPANKPAKRAPARKTAKRSANKAVRRAPVNRPAKHAPARKAAKRSAKKAVRRA
jgi:DNA-binding protein HU-beta